MKNDFIDFVQIIVVILLSFSIGLVVGGSVNEYLRAKNVFMSIMEAK
jgi:hypothetical protein